MCISFAFSYSDPLTLVAPVLTNVKEFQIKHILDI